MNEFISYPDLREPVTISLASVGLIAWLSGHMGGFLRLIMPSAEFDSFVLVDNHLCSRYGDDFALLNARCASLDPDPR